LDRREGEISGFNGDKIMLRGSMNQKIYTVLGYNCGFLEIIKFIGRS
jgi:hypothetical protein